MPSPMRLPRVGEEMVIFSVVVPEDFNMEFEMAVARFLEDRQHSHPALAGGIDFAQAKSALLQMIGNQHFRMHTAFSEPTHEDDEDDEEYLTDELPFDDDTPFDEPF